MVSPGVSTKSNLKLLCENIIAYFYFSDFTNMEKIIFSFGDKLPTTYDAAITIFSICSTPASARMSNVICQYASALINIWEKAFGSNHVMSHGAVNVKLNKLIKDYYNKVYNKHHRKSKKKKIISKKVDEKNEEV